MAKNRATEILPTDEQQQIDAWKRQYGDGNILCVLTPHKNVDPTHKLKSFVKKPSLVTMSKIARFGEEHINKAIDIFFEDSYLAGDPEVLQYDEYKISVFKSAMPLFEVPDSEVVKL